jgi:hypothetical protein
VRRVALLGRHTPISADRCGQRGGVDDTPRDGETDQPDRRAQDHIARLDIQMDVAESAQIVQRGGDLDSRRQVLLLLEWTVATDQRGKPGPVDLLQNQMRGRKLSPTDAQHHSRLSASRRESGESWSPRRVTSARTQAPSVREYSRSAQPIAFRSQNDESEAFASTT